MHVFRQQMFTQASMEGPGNTRKNKTECPSGREPSMLHTPEQWLVVYTGGGYVGVSGRALVHGLINTPELLTFFLLHQLQASVSLI